MRFRLVRVDREITVLNWKDGARPQKEPKHVYVGRPSKYGNPYMVKGVSLGSVLIPGWSPRDEAIREFEVYARETLELEPDWLDPLLDAEALICHCAPLACHADVLVRLIGERQRALSGASPARTRFPVEPVH
jgi:hypothetical protein